MKITAGQNQETPAELPGSALNQARNERLATGSSASSTVEKTATAAGTLVAKPIEPRTDVTLRRDNNGRVYYVVSDADSGQEILEVPPKALRDVGQGIEDYLKGEQSKASSHVKVKA
jgi:hypothetical protein